MNKKERRVIFSIVSISVFVLLSILVFFKKTFVDDFISNSFINSWNPTANWFFIFLGKYSQSIMIGLAILISLILYLQKRRKGTLIFIFSLGIGYILEKIIKIIIQRERPLIQLIQETSFSFPSGNSVFSIILFSLIIYFYKDEINNKFGKIVFISVGIFIIFLVGFSRIYLNVHWFTDVIGGYALGFSLVNIAILFLEKK